MILSRSTSESCNGTCGTLLSLSPFRQIDLFSIANATDIHGTKYDDPANPVAEDGELTSSVKAATYVSFVNILATADLSKFGLHNGKHTGFFYRRRSFFLCMFTNFLYVLLVCADSPDDITLIAAKWESLAVASVNDPAFPDDYFLFTAVRPSPSSIHLYLLVFLPPLTFTLTYTLLGGQRFHQYTRGVAWSQVQCRVGCR